jgi:hypothetical protein
MDTRYTPDSHDKLFESICLFTSSKICLCFPHPPFQYNSSTFRMFDLLRLEIL